MPPASRDLNRLNPVFRVQLEAWLAEARAAFPQYTFGITEAHRTRERQEALWAQGRTTPGPVVTWTLQSRHLSGEAVDWHLAQGGRALWDEDLYRSVYEAVPLERYGLRTLEGDLVHLEFVGPVSLPSGRLIVLLDAGGVEVGRVPLTPGADVLTRVSADGRRVYVRPDER